MIIILKDKPGGHTQVVVSDSTLGEGHVEFKLTSPTEVEVRDERAIDRDDWDELPEVERIAIAVWNQGSADTTQMLKAVRAALQAERRRLGEHDTEARLLIEQLGKLSPYQRWVAVYDARTHQLEREENAPAPDFTHKAAEEMLTAFDERYPAFKRWLEEYARLGTMDPRVVDTAQATIDLLEEAGRRRAGSDVCMIPGCGCDGTPHP